MIGILAGIMWAMETVILGKALGMAPFTVTQHAVVLAPFVGTFLHDLCSSAFAFLYNIFNGKPTKIRHLLKNPRIKWLIAASAIGGPVGMTGYVMAVNYMGASVGAVASAVYPAVGTVLAYLFLKEKVRWYQWIFLILTMLGVYGLSYSPGLQMDNFWLGLLGAFMCAFGWGIEAVILAKCLKDPDIKNEFALWIRQTTSALLYGVVIVPVLRGWKFTFQLLSGENKSLLMTIGCAALFATVSYLLYYKAIARLGASRAMTLNITYTAWTIIISVVIFQDLTILDPLTLSCAFVVVVCGILSAVDFKRRIFS